MADQQLDAMLQEQGQASAPQAVNGDQPQATVAEPAAQQSEEEVEFNKLSGSTQNRIQELVRQKREAYEQGKREAMASYVPAPQNPQLTMDQESAIKTLSNFGIATKDQVEATVNEKLNLMRWEAEQTRLEGKYTGEDGGPKYDRSEVEDYIISHPQFRGYAPEDVFKFKMYPDEFNNLRTQTGSSTGHTETFRPTKGLPQNNAMTPEYIEQKLKEPNGQQWYEEHLDEINAAVADHTKKFNNFGQSV